MKIVVIAIVAVAMTLIAIRTLQVIPHQVAGVIGGTVFISMSVFMLSKIWSWPRRFKSFTFWMICVHLLVGSLPLFLTRVLNWGVSFDQLKVLALQSYNLYAFSVDRLMGYVEALKATAGN